MRDHKYSLKGILKRGFKAEITRVFSLTAVSTFIKMLTGFVSTKIVSVFAGPAGIALVGQLQNFTSIVLSLSNGGITNGIVKYVAQYKDEKEKLKNYISTSYTITLLSSVVCALFMIIFNQKLSNIVFKDISYRFVFIFFGLSVTLYSLNILLMSILNGLKRFRKYVIINIAGSIIGMLFTIVLAMLLGVKGALIAIVTYQSVVFIVTYLMVRREDWLNKDYFHILWDRSEIKAMAKFSIMALVTTITLPLVHILLRNYVIEKISIEAAGYWEGMNRLSAAYLVFVSTSFAVYYLPKLSESKSNALIRREIKKVIMFIVPIVFVIFLLMFIFKRQIITLLYTEQFMPMSNLFLPQLIGDFLKIVSWSLSYILLAKSMMKEYVILELLSPIVFLFLSYNLVNIYGVIGITYSYDVSIIIYLSVLFFIFRNLLKPEKEYGK